MQNNCVNCSGEDCACCGVFRDRQEPEEFLYNDDFVYDMYRPEPGCEKCGGSIDEWCDECGLCPDCCTCD